MLYRDENDRILILTREIGMFMKVHLVKPTIEFVDWAEKHRIEIDNWNACVVIFYITAEK